MRNRRAVCAEHTFPPASQMSSANDTEPKAEPNARLTTAGRGAAARCRYS